MKIVVLGGPGAGKGTQLMKISQRLGMVHISTGDIFRENISKQTELGKLADSYISKGQLVPNEVTCNMVADRLQKEDCKNGYALDGFPRTIEQAIFLGNYLKENNEDLDAVVDIEVPDEMIVDRLCGRRVCSECGASFHIKYTQPKQEGVCDHCGATLIQRKDDQEETIQNRLQVYHNQTEPLIAFYRSTGKLLEIDGNGTADEVECRILSALGVAK